MYSLRHSFCVVAAATLSVVCAQAQEMSKEVRVDVKKITFQTQNTPQFNVQNMVDKRWKPKAWLEIDVEFEGKKAQSETDTSPVIDSLDFKYFVAVNKVDKATGKHVVLTASITYINITAKESQRALAFVAPASLAKVLEKNTFINTDIRAVGVEIYKGGALAGWLSTSNGRWWEKMDQFSVVDGALLSKAQTPFAPLWGDYDAEVAKK